MGQHPIRSQSAHNTSTITNKITKTVAEAADCPIHELPPLYEVIDPDALANLFAPTFEGEERTTGQVTFTYFGYKVTVKSTGNITTNPI
ncbi:hypothetical protein DMJ13_22790 [halophilic archaeon]|nr:hypothetical protein DMJ13_22790 [halophilic archaeon]